MPKGRPSLLNGPVTEFWHEQSAIAATGLATELGGRRRDAHGPPPRDCSKKPDAVGPKGTVENL